MTAHTSLPQDFERTHRTERVHLEVLSNSAIACYRRCQREFKYRYVQKRRPRRKSEALRFGTLFHLGLNAWWLCYGEAADKLNAAIMAMRFHASEKDEDVSPFDLVKAEELMLGYTARWGGEAYETVPGGVEKQFDMPLINPATGRASKTYRLHGAIDVIAKKPNGRLTQVEHKTTASDIEAGSDYWRKVSALDPQVSTYQPACKALGFDVEDCTYDVIRKVGLVPFKATPEEKRTYTQEKSKACPFCKKTANVPGPHQVGTPEEPAFCVDGRIITEAGGQLYKNQHAHDETPDEYAVRVRAHIAATPERYFARGPIVRLEQDESEHALDVWQTASQLRESENADAFPRSPNACERFHRLCEYFDVCSGMASIGDESRFRTAEHAHEELTKEV